jgi:AraC family transcriptional regulator
VQSKAGQWLTAFEILLTLMTGKNLMLADIHILHRSEHYQVVDFRCHCDVCSVSQAEYNHAFCISFIRKGFFEYRTFRRNSEVYAGRLHISKPGYEHTTRHIDQQPDLTTTIEFTASFFEHIRAHYQEAAWFLNNNDIHSLVMQCSVATELLQQRLLSVLQNKGQDRLKIDELVFAILEHVIDIAGNVPELPTLPESLIKHHLGTIERAREYILQHFREDISLEQLATHCHVSPFHFTRIFKSVLLTSPHKYLSEVRLHHGRLLVETTNAPVTDIAFDCGFSSAEHFTTAYKKMFGQPPSVHRAQPVL